MAEEPEGPENLDEPPPFFPKELAGEAAESASELIRCRIEGVFAAENDANITRFVVLSDGARRLPILIGPYEATAISLPLSGERPDRPMTHDLLKTIIDRLGYEFDRVVIDDLWNGIFYAKIHLKKGDEDLEIDARPSDAVAMAIRFDAPIFVSDEILATGAEVE
ncbi:MAG: bifunctional nuclease family protein [Fimbriimonadaceae bacterium]|nr:bifunctional nuclease family protein [Fimbriimonadaceae bacterium]